MIEYKIVQAATKDQMEKQVNTLLKEGFHLSGDTNFFSVRYEGRSKWYIDTEYHQVMIKVDGKCG